MNNKQTGDVGQKERITQNRVVALFKNKLGYSYLGNFEDRDNNSNVEEELLSSFLIKSGYDESLIKKAIFEFVKTVKNQSRGLYDVNREVYSLLRYGVKVKKDIGENTETVWFIDWENPLNNDFSIAEEVTVQGKHSKRPDLVVYINGIAVAVIELKRSTVSVTEGIRQNRDSQKELFIQRFFHTIQYVCAGNDTEGMRYGAIETKEKYYLAWKEVSEEQNPHDEYLLRITKPVRNIADKETVVLDQNIIQIFYKERFVELLHDFIVYDRGIKKLCRSNQYFGVKASADFVKRREGGIVWHTQGSGKSLTMVWLAKWIRENVDNSRVLIITDREELDDQIEKVFIGVDEKILRTTSGRNLIDVLNSANPWLVCSLIHKFGNKEEPDYSEYIDQISKIIPTDFRAKGDIYVFVDEAHRTQGGDLHKAMKTILPSALFIGFTGTPLLKKDKQKSIEVFGRYIHTYKFDEAVKDKVVLDLRYEARDVEQKITSMDNIDKWFESKTRGLTEYAKTEIKRKWGTLQKVFSSRSRLEKIVADILMDMETKTRLQNGRGNALLVSGSIYQACRYYEMFQKSGFIKCAIVTSYSANHNTIKGEESGEGTTERLQQYEIYKKMLADWFHEDPETAVNKTDKFETEVKKKFVEEPAQMKLLIVVDKLLTGFDAPSATYLYIDKKMQDHGLFQAICRVNRLDDEDKEYGYIVDYKDLFKSLESSVKDYTSGVFDSYDKEDVEGLLKDRLVSAREDLDDALEAIRSLCEPVSPPKSQNDYIHYFCGSSRNPDDLKDTEPRRVALYKTVSTLLRAYANIADEMQGAGYSEKEALSIVEEIRHFENVRKEIQLTSGDYVDMKQYEPAMRHLIDTYIGAEESRVLSNFDDMALVDLIVERGKEFTSEIPDNIRNNHESMAETIENNLRKLIIQEMPINPAYYGKMSALLDGLIRERNSEAKEYEKYLKEIIELAKKIRQPSTSDHYPPSMNTSAKRSLYDNLSKDEDLTVEVDREIREKKYEDWRGNQMKERHVKMIIRDVLSKYGKDNDETLEGIFELVKNQREY